MINVIWNVYNSVYYGVGHDNIIQMLNTQKRTVCLINKY